MKTLKKLSAAVVLTFVLAVTAFAGDIDIPGSTPPPPPNSVTTQGGIDLPGATDEAATSDSVISVAMSLLEDILSF